MQVKLTPTPFFPGMDGKKGFAPNEANTVLKISPGRRIPCGAPSWCPPCGERSGIGLWAERVSPSSFGCGCCFASSLSDERELFGGLSSRRGVGYGCHDVSDTRLRSSASSERGGGVAPGERAPTPWRFVLPEVFLRLRTRCQCILLAWFPIATSESGWFSRPKRAQRLFTQRREPRR